MDRTWAMPVTEIATPSWVYTCGLSIVNVMVFKEILFKMKIISKYKTKHIHADRWHELEATPNINGKAKGA